MIITHHIIDKKALPNKPNILKLLKSPTKLNVTLLTNHTNHKKYHRINHAREDPPNIVNNISDRPDDPVTDSSLERHNIAPHATTLHIKNIPVGINNKNVIRRIEDTSSIILVVSGLL